jgi:hypothetical protein
MGILRRCYDASLTSQTTYRCVFYCVSLCMSYIVKSDWEAGIATVDNVIEHSDAIVLGVGPFACIHVVCIAI